MNRSEQAETRRPWNPSALGRRALVVGLVLVGLVSAAGASPYALLWARAEALGEVAGPRSLAVTTAVRPEAASVALLLPEAWQVRTAGWRRFGPEQLPAESLLVALRTARSEHLEGPTFAPCSPDSMGGFTVAGLRYAPLGQARYKIPSLGEDVRVRHYQLVGGAFSEEAPGGVRAVHALRVDGASSPAALRRILRLLLAPTMDVSGVEIADEHALGEAAAAMRRDVHG